MHPLSPGDDVKRALFVAGCVYLLLGACVLLSSLAQELLQRMVVPLRQARGPLETDWKDEGMNSDAQQAAQEFQRTKLSLIKPLLPIAHFASMICVAAMWWGGTLPTSFLQNCSALANATIWMAIWKFPSALTPGSANWIYSAMMAILSATVWPIAVSADAVMMYAGATWVVALGLSIAFLNPWLNAVWIFVINAMCCLSLVVGQRGSGQCASADPLRGSLQLSTISVVTVLCIFVFDRLLYQLTRLELEAQSSRNELGATQSVLRSICDVVVVVDHALQLREDSPGLRNMLLLNQRQSVRQEDVRSFLASAEDRAKFDEQMAAATVAGQPVSKPPRLSVAFHVSMKENQQFYLVGIREQQSGERAAELPRYEGKAGPLLPNGLPYDEGDERVRSSSSLSSGSSSARTLEDANVSACVDLLSPAWKIDCVTSAFQTHMRLSEEDDGFLTLVNISQRKRLISFVQSAYFQHEDRVAPATATLGDPILLRSAYMRRRNLCLCASLELDWCPSPCPLSQGNQILVRMTLVEISWVSSRRYGPRAMGDGHPHATPRSLKVSAAVPSIPRNLEVTV
ncbi:unnamed protein product [Prorocentrum cordatum]|uniref:Uncharacterized protein n=1 Tax=Prorocentrum cordatum TaxID=2364126 RepID=A0ABN9QT84_9DINO|nr:unnamed protein product [Polarella glacialis]